MKALSGLGDAHPNERGAFTLLSLLVQMVISSREILTDTGGPVKLTHKINYHTWTLQK